MNSICYDEFAEIKKSFLRKKSERDSILANVEMLEDILKRKEEMNKANTEARLILQKIAQSTQDNLKFQLSNLVTVAIQSIFDGGISFEVTIEQRRNQTEIDMYVNDNGKLQEPLESSGHGLVDIISLALRVSYWSLKKNRGVFILDEPLRNLSRDHSVAASKMLKMLCDKLGLQIIMVSHDEQITDYADKVFRVTKEGKISHVKEV